MRRWCAADPKDPKANPSAPAGKGHDEDFLLLTPPQGEVRRFQNHLWYYSEVTEEGVLDLNVALQDMARDQRRKAVDDDRDPSPVHLHIHSYGGSLFAAFSVVDAILTSKVPIHTHVEGAAASAATLISVCGTHRTIGRHSFMLIHQLSSGFWGKFEEQKDEMKNNTLLMQRIRALYSERTKLPKKELDGLLKRDLWLDAETALKYGLVDEIR